MACVLVPLAQGCEELEAVTIIDLLRRADIKVITAGLDGKPVQASRGTVLVPDTTLDKVDARTLDMIVLPGGLPGADHLKNDPRLRQLLLCMSQRNKFIAAICAAPMVLASVGLLDGKRATSYPGALDDMEINNMNYQTLSVVRDGNIITSRGPGTAMDFALELIEILLDGQKRNSVEAALQRPTA